jgi:hypothetical protein
MELLMVTDKLCLLKSKVILELIIYFLNFRRKKDFSYH